VLKISSSDVLRIKSNIARLESLSKEIHDLSYFVTASQSGAVHILDKLLEEKIVRGRPLVLAKLRQAQFNENNQKLALDAPHRFSAIMREAEEIIAKELAKEKTELVEEQNGRK